MAKRKPAEPKATSPKKAATKSKNDATSHLTTKEPWDEAPPAEPIAQATPKNIVGLGWFAGSLHEMTREEHIAKLRNFQEHGTFDAKPPQATSSAPTPTKSTKTQEQNTDRSESSEDSLNGQDGTTTRADSQTEGEMRGDVASPGAGSGSLPGEDLLDSASRARLSGEKKHEYWERMRKAARLAGLPRGQGPGTAYQWATAQTEREFPPPVPVVVAELVEDDENPTFSWVAEEKVSPIGDKTESPAAESVRPTVGQTAKSDGQDVSGLSDLPADWPELPANAQLQVEIAWVTANRLRVRDGTGVNLSRALSPAPSYSALSWLETSILFPSKFADISVKATASQDDEKEFIKREKLAIEEIRSILKEMLDAKTG